MKVIRPACATAIGPDRVTGPHSEHLFLQPFDGQRTAPLAGKCGGCTAEQAAALALADAAQARQEHGQPGGHIEVGPAVSGALCLVAVPEPTDPLGQWVGVHEGPDEELRTATRNAH